MNLERSGGVLLHITSLPGPYGIGDLGSSAHDFVDWLAATGCRLWQVLPIGPTGHGNSPYDSPSVFAGNPNMVSPELLLRDGLLVETDLRDGSDLHWRPSPESSSVDFDSVAPWKLSLLDLAFRRFQHSRPKRLVDEFDKFQDENGNWLDEYSLFMSLKELHDGVSWMKWPGPIRRREKSALAEARRSLAPTAARFAFHQFLFFRQWSELSSHARNMGIQLIGDVAIFAAGDSSDVWSHPELFCVNLDGSPEFVAGVPPDYFSPTGQLWGNPLYRWEEHRRSSYDWWLQRLATSLSLVDIVRIDHFRGFAAFWEIQAGAPTAEVGRWVAGPAEELLQAIVRRLGFADREGDLPFVAEDLGVTTPDVIRLLDRYNLPGMRVLQFGFSGLRDSFLPHNYVENCVAYTGTHDNDTTRGWFETCPRHEREAALKYLQSTPREIVRDMLQAVWTSKAAFAIVPMQDLLELGTEARMNHPGRPDGNWGWRLLDGELSEALGEKLIDLNSRHGRSGR